MKKPPKTKTPSLTSPTSDSSPSSNGSTNAKHKPKQRDAFHLHLYDRPAEVGFLGYMMNQRTNRIMAFVHIDGEIDFTNQVNGPKLPPTTTQPMADFVRRVLSQA